MKEIKKKNKAIQIVEEIHGEKIEELLRRLFVDEHLSHKEISSKLNLSYVTVIRYLEKAGIYSRRLHIEDGS